MGFGGYLNPFTLEAQVNTLKPTYSIPMTCVHEMAHQFGIASESECNFIGYLVAQKSDNLYLNYSAYTYALKTCLSKIRKKDPILYHIFLNQLNTGVKNNFDESYHYWNNHQSFIDKGFKWFYDNFLKLNQQPDGLNSYSKFIDLVIGYQKVKYN